MSKRARGVAIHRPIVYGNDAWIVPETERVNVYHTHRWTVAIRSAAAPRLSNTATTNDITFGGADDLSCFIKRVTFKLHETIPNPLRTVEKPPFEVTETGWGEFEVQIKIFFISEANEKPLTIHHHLKLHPWPLSLLDGPNNLVAPAPAVTEKEAAPPTSAETSLAVKTETVEKAQQSANTEGSAQAAQGPGADQAQPIEIDAEGEPDSALLPPVETSSNPTQPPAAAVGLPAPPPVLSPVHSWQYDEIVFSEPTEMLYNILIRNPTTLLPQSSERQHLRQLQNGVGGAIGELTGETEEKEGRRLDFARKEILEELERLRTKLIDSESKLRQRKSELYFREDD